MSQMPGHDQPQNQFNYQLQGEQPSPGPQDYSGQGYGNQGRGSQAYGGPAYGNQAYGNQAYGGPVYGVGHPQGQPGAGMPGRDDPGRRKPWLVPAIIAGVLVLIGAAVLIVVLLTSNDDDKSGGPENDPTSQASDGPTDGPTDGLTETTTPTPTPIPTAPTPTAPPTSSGDLSLRSAPVGSDEEQIKQLTEDFGAWYKSVTSGEGTDCSQMDQFFLEPDDDDKTGCTSASDVDFDFEFNVTDIKVSGDTATGTMNSTITIDGSTPQSSSDDVKLAKRDGYWFFDE